MEIVLFRIRPRADVDEVEYGRAFEEMVAIASSMPGFVDIEGYTAEDGSEMAVARFTDPESLARWRNHPEHLRTQQRGRDEFFESYDITVATMTRQYDWKR